MLRYGIPHLHILSLPIALLYACVRGDEIPGNCNPAHDHLDPSSHKFISSCHDSMYCAPLDSTNLSTGELAEGPQVRISLARPIPPSRTFASDPETAGNNIGGVCLSRLCRRDEFPFGFPPDRALPPICPKATFCPDNGSGCRAALPPGSPCEVARDEQCTSLSGTDDQHLCLNHVCMYANATFSALCVMENTTYTFSSPSTRTPYSLSVVRHDCVMPSLYCDPQSLLCVSAKKLGESCEADFQCETITCDRGMCAKPVDVPNEVAPWHLAITIFIILVAMVMASSVLILIHRRHRYVRFKELREYYVDQLNLRREIIALHGVNVGSHLAKLETS
ncbi:hypothetical protein P691DRAFT_565510 [Macrolepiota fuliginosa MF-IS2]|uniref:Uncharacterized protein n=1 Tax=Macrolepiota fuliginosa MF-IS2 TaxID=1400762 RepID=A0A9P6C5J8_9AGAR|nr:hypothetical protein P691DRAFT_565510 [Macrolepiota fuliginosa MF-IS2]